MMQDVVTGNQAGQHEAMVQEILANLGGTGSVEVHGGYVTRVVGNKEIAIYSMIQFFLCYIFNKPIYQCFVAFCDLFDSCMVFAEHTCYLGLS